MIDYIHYNFDRDINNKVNIIKTNNLERLKDLKNYLKKNGMNKEKDK